jgi:DNA gyrase subunit B
MTATGTHTMGERTRMASTTKDLPSDKAAKAEDYNQDSIQVREGMEHVRTRPAMYIGDVHERGLHHLVSEVVDNSVDEAMAGFCTRIEVTIHTDGSISVLDDGRGIPVAIHSKVKKPTLEVCLTILGAGGKFDKGTYKVSGGLHGVGVSCVNALAEWLDAEVYREGRVHHMRFSRGQTVKQLEQLGTTDKRGTKITFKPDGEIFRASTEFKFERLSKRLKELAYLNAGLRITLRDERGEGKSEEYHYPEGLVAFVNALSGSENQLLPKPIMLNGGADSAESRGRVEVEIAIQYNDTYTDTIVSYVNNINTIDGGTHETGFRTAITTTLNNWLKENDKSDKGADERPTGDDYREGLVAVVSVKIPEPQFEGQTKGKLGNSDVAGIVQNVVGEYLRAWVEHHPAETKKIIAKAQLARKARLEAKKAKELVRKTKDALRGGGISKLRDAESTNPDECELFLVEGDSAGGTATEARDSRTQAILPLRGKILNVWKSSHDKMLEHNEIANIIQALGTGILDDFDITKCQFGKVVIMCDADVDGSHIRTLILTFFFRQMNELIKHGRVYCAQPPLYKITYRGAKAKKPDGAAEDEAEEAEEAEDEAPKAKKEKGTPARKKKEEYVLNQADFDRKMLARGLDGATLEVKGAKKKTFGAAEVQKLVELVGDMKRIGHEVERAGVPLAKYLARRNKDGLLPYAKVVLMATKDAPAVYTEAELESHLQTFRGKGLKVWQNTDPLSERQAADVEVTRFGSKARLEEILRELERFGLGWEGYFPQKPKTSPTGEVLTEVPFVLRREKDEQPLLGLSELPDGIRKLAQTGITIQRYKGLGEMDADELEETTMDPKRRKLLKVTMEDMAAAQEKFSVLMGTKVEPRKDYIEKYAEDVTNLDV